MRQLFSYVGVGAFVVCLLACLMCGYALACGVHCLDCDRAKLTHEQVAFWQHWFAAKNVILVIGIVLTLLAIPFASNRRYAAVGLMFALVAGVFTTLR